MKLPMSKKELYRDNLKLRAIVDNLTAVNIELVIKMEQQNERIDKINAKNKKIMEDYEKQRA